MPGRAVHAAVGRWPAQGQDEPAGVFGNAEISGCTLTSEFILMQSPGGVFGIQSLCERRRRWAMGRQVGAFGLAFGLGLHTCEHRQLSYR